MNGHLLPRSRVSLRCVLTWTCAVWTAAVGLLFAGTWAGVAPPPPAVAAGPVRARPAEVRPSHQQIIVRADRVDLVANGRPVRTVPRPGGVIEVSWLASKLSRRWLSDAGGGTVRLSAELVLGRGVLFEVGPLTRRLELVGGPDPREAAGVSVGSGTLFMFNTTVVSVDPATNRPVAAGLAGRPWISVGTGGRVEVRDTQIIGLGGGTGTHSAGLFLGPGATGSIIRSTFKNNNTGLVVSRTRSVVVDTVAVRGSSGTGVALRDDVETKIGGLVSTDNGEDGVSVSGLAGRHVTGLQTGHNRRYGVRVADTRGAQIMGIRSTDDKIGLALDSCQACTVRNLRVQGGTVGLQIGGSSAGVTVNGGTIANAATGARIAATAGPARINGLSVAAATDTGVALCGADVALDTVTVSSKRTGVTICGQSTGGRLVGGTVRAGRTGVTVTAPASRASVTDTAIVGGSGAGVEISASGVALNRVRVERAHTGVHVYGQARDTVLDGVTIRGGRDGVVATGTAGRLTMLHPSISGLSGAGVSSGVNGLSIQAGSIGDAHLGVNLRGSSHISDLVITDVAKGFKISQGGHADTRHIDVLATKIGVQVGEGGSFALTDSRVRASRALIGRVDQYGNNDVMLPPFPWYGFAAIATVMLALLLESIHRIRTGRARKTLAPDHVVNTA